MSFRLELAASDIMRRLRVPIHLALGIIFCMSAHPGLSQDEAQNPTAAPAPVKVDQPKRIKIGAPEPAPQAFPDSSVLPAGADSAVSPNFPGSSEKSPATSPPQQHQGEFIFAPIPFSNQVFSFGLAPVVQYVFPVNSKDPQSHPSSLVVTGMIAQRASWALGGGGRLFLNHDRYRLSFFGGHGDVSYALFGVGTSGGNAGKSVPIEQGGDLAFIEILFKLKGKLYVGPRFNYRRLTANLKLNSDSVNLPPGVDSVDLGSLFNTYAPGFEVQHDTRTDLFYPTKGHVFQLDGDFFRATESLQNNLDRDVTYEQYRVSYNQYLPLSPSQVLALRGMVCDVDGNPPFYELCQFGAMSDIRGYQVGRFRDRRMFATQAEYRKILTNRLGFVLFAGVGEVAHTWDSFDSENLLPGGGTGIRFNLAKKQRINMRADVAYGTTGWSWNFFLGEAF